MTDYVCPVCHDWAARCARPDEHRQAWYLVAPPTPPQRPRSVVGTTLLVMLTVVLAPVLLIGGCGALGSLGTDGASTVIGSLVMLGVVIAVANVVVRRIDK